MHTLFSGHTDRGEAVKFVAEEFLGVSPSIGLEALAQHSSTSMHFHSALLSQEVENFCNTMVSGCNSGRGAGALSCASSAPVKDLSDNHHVSPCASPCDSRTLFLHLRDPTLILHVALHVPYREIEKLAIED